MNSHAGTGTIEVGGEKGSDESGIRTHAPKDQMMLKHQCCTETVLTLVWRLRPLGHLAIGQSRDKSDLWPPHRDSPGRRQKYRVFDGPRNDPTSDPSSERVRVC